MTVSIESVCAFVALGLGVYGVVILARIAHELLQLRTHLEQVDKTPRVAHHSIRQEAPEYAIQQDRYPSHPLEEDAPPRAAIPRLYDDAAQFEAMRAMYPDTQPADQIHTCTGWYEQDERLAKEEELARLMARDPDEQVRIKSFLDKYLEG